MTERIYEKIADAIFNEKQDLKFRGFAPVLIAGSIDTYVPMELYRQYEHMSDMVLLNGDRYEPNIDRSPLKLWGIEMICDPLMPEGQIEMRDSSGNVLGRITGIGTD